MDAIVVAGAMSFGVVVGWLVRYFIRRFSAFTPKTLSAVISIVGGGTVVRFLAADVRAVWLYSIGLLLGFIIYSLVAWLARRRDDDDDSGILYRR